MKLTMKAALEMLEAIAQLDGYRNGGDHLTVYKFPGDLRLKVAIARRKLRAIQDDYQEERNTLIRTISGGEALTTQTHMTEFAKLHKEMLAAEIEVDIQPLPVESFNLDENPIPPSVLDLLGDLMEMKG